MKRGIVGSLIGAMLLVAVCAGPAPAGRRMQPARVSVQPRMASSHQPVTGRESKLDATKDTRGGYETSDDGNRGWHDLTIDRHPSIDDVAHDPPRRVAPHDHEVVPAVHQDTPTSQPPAEDRAAPQELRIAEPTPYTDPLSQLLREVPATRIADRPAAEPIPEHPYAADDLSVVPVWDPDIKRLRERIADLEEDREFRRLNDRVRDVQMAEYGEDVTDERWNHTWGGRIQADIVNWPDDIEFGGQPNYVEFRRLRFFCSGEGYGVWNYKLEFDIVPDVRAERLDIDDLVDVSEFGLEVKDAWLGITDLPVFGYVRAGHFKVPFSLEAMTSSKYITFMERGLPRELLPGREFGVAMYRFFPGHNLTFAAGAFYDELSPTAHAFEDDNQGYRVATRVTWAPRYDVYTEGRYLLHTGLSFLYTHDADDLVRFRGRPEINSAEFLVDTGDLMATHVRHTGAEMAWVHGPLSAQGEVVYSEVNLPGPGVANFWGAYGSVSCFLTGEHRPYDLDEGVFGRVKPFENFWCVNTVRGCAAGLGAWEVAARLSYLEFKEIDGQELLDVTAGLNWYWNPYSRLMLNWVHPFRHDYTSGHAQGDVVGLRFQVDF